MIFVPLMEEPETFSGAQLVLGEPYSVWRALGSKPAQKILSVQRVCGRWGVLGKAAPERWETIKEGGWRMMEVVAFKAASVRLNLQRSSLLTESVSEAEHHHHPSLKSPPRSGDRRQVG
jgi:hypothetical protein